jgi:hypothetical protein
MTTAVEKITSRSVSEGLNARAELRYIVRGTSDETVAIGQIRTDAPATYTTTSGVVLSLTDVSVEPTEAPETWEGRASYGRQPQRGTPDFSFDVGAGNAHRTQSIKTISKTAANGAGAVPDNFGAIGVSQHNGSYSVAGVDVVVPQYHWQETHRIAGALVTQEYKLALFDLTGTTNADAWEGFDTGEVLFMGASGKLRDDGDFDITFKFAASLNVADACADWPASAKPAAAVPKKGWEYLWVRYEDALDNARITKKPVAVYIEQVYKSGDFDDLTPRGI